MFSDPGAVVWVMPRIKPASITVPDGVRATTPVSLMSPQAASTPINITRQQGTCSASRHVLGTSAQLLPYPTVRRNTRIRIRRVTSKGRIIHSPNAFRAVDDCPVSILLAAFAIDPALYRLAVWYQCTWHVPVMARPEWGRVAFRCRMTPRHSHCAAVSMNHRRVSLQLSSTSACPSARPHRSNAQRAHAVCRLSSNSASMS